MEVSKNHPINYPINGPVMQVIPNTWSRTMAWTLTTGAFGEMATNPNTVAPNMNHHGAAPWRIWDHMSISMEHLQNIWRKNMCLKLVSDPLKNMVQKHMASCKSSFQLEQVNQPSEVVCLRRKSRDSTGMTSREVCTNDGVR